MRMKKNFFWALLSVLLMLNFNNVYAEETGSTTESSGAAEKLVPVVENIEKYEKLFDDSVSTRMSFGKGDTVTIKAEEGKAIKSLYIKWGKETVYDWELVYAGESYVMDSVHYLHDFIELDSATTEITLNFPKGNSVADIELFSEGEVPTYVQKWQPSLVGKADVQVFSTHADDDTVFLGCAIVDCVQKGYKVQVVYMAQNWTGMYANPDRQHERIDGLWTMGITNYPDCMNYDDLYSEDYETALTQFDLAAVTESCTQMIRKYRPKVIITQDFNGEYGHGQHIVMVNAIAAALEHAEDPLYQPESVIKYGTYAVPKTYMHLYEENKLILDIRQPLEHFGGRNAVEVAKEGYAKHLSQQWTRFRVYEENSPYSSADYGLYRTLVGLDTENDFMCNVVPYGVSEEAVIEISEPEDLFKIVENPSASVVMLEDVDMSGIDWKPIRFAGKFYGQGHTIYNLSVNECGNEIAYTYDGNWKKYETYFAGLFSVISEDAEIENLNLVNAKIKVTEDRSSFVGAIAGYSEGGKIVNCSVEAYLELDVEAPQWGIGGIVGYGHGLVSDCNVDVTAVGVDLNQAVRDEQFLGGICGGGYMDMNANTVHLDGYISEGGYCHNGGLIGIYLFYPKKDLSYRGSIKNNAISGRIRFFENNTNRRAYCKVCVGEAMNERFDFSGNTFNGEEISSVWKDGAIRDEVKEYDVILRPEMCMEPVYEVTQVPASEETQVGWTVYTCQICGYSYKDEYRMFVPTPTPTPTPEPTNTPVPTATNTPVPTATYVPVLDSPTPIPTPAIKDDVSEDNNEKKSGDGNKGIIVGSTVAAIALLVLGSAIIMKNNKEK